MVAVDYWLGDAGEDYAEVVVVTDTAGAVAISSAGASSAIAADPATEFGIVKVRVMGLAADTVYPFTVLLDGVQRASGIFRTMPTGAGWSFAFGSCLSAAAPCVFGYQIARTHDARMFFALGDTPYVDAGTDWHAVAGVGRWYNTGAQIKGAYAAWQDGRVTWDKNYWALHQQPGWGYMARRVPLFRLPDDHEYGNDWDWTYNNPYCQSLFLPQPVNQGDADLIGLYANQSQWSWNKGNPVNTDAEIGNWKPSACLDSAANHPPKYYRKRVGDVEFFHLDFYAHMDPQTTKTNKPGAVCIDAAWNADLGYSYSDPTGAALAKTALGPYQLNWFLTRLLSSTAKFKVVMCGKVSYLTNCVSDNRGWDPHYRTERDYIMAFIKRYVTGVLWCVGDVHSSGVYNDLSGHAEVNSSPLGQCMYINRDGTILWKPGYQHPMSWRQIGAESDKWQNHNTYGIVEVRDEYLHPMIYTISGKKIWEGYLQSGKNYLVPTPSHARGEWA